MWGSEADRLAFGRLYPLWVGSDATPRTVVDALAPLMAAAYPPALHTMGAALFDGRGARRDYPTSFKYHLAAADRGYPASQAEVGNYFVITTPIHHACPHDPDQGLTWYRRAAEQGNPGAAYNLSLYFLEGMVVAPDPGAAYEWARVSIACSAVHNPPAEALCEQAAAGLSPDDRTAAEVRVTARLSGLPHPWSDHLPYWRILARAAGAVDD